VDGYAVPFAYYDNGHYNLWVSSAKGDVYEYRDITSNIYAIWPCTDTLIHGTEGTRGQYYNLAASGTYIDTDNVIDMALGLYGGGIQFFTSINPAAVSSLPVAHAFQLYPNPARDAVTVKITTPGWKPPFHAALYNSMGQLVQQDKMLLTTKSMDVSALPSGLYLMKLHSSSGEFVQKFFVTR
jgi:hypothetical protein